jgi:pilus assembly protein CpaB
MIRTLILLGALGAGGIAAWLAISVQSDSPTPVAIVERSPTVEVLVASADIGQGQKLGPESLGWKPWPEGAVPPGFIVRATRPDAVEALAGSVVRDRFVAGDPIREEKLARKDSSLLASNLVAGRRAVAIRISAESSAGGLLLPNDRVDVVQTVSRDGQGDAVSRTILRNVRVLAIDQKIDEATPKEGETANGGTVVGKTATLELDETQTEIITGAQASGLLSLALRSVEDRDEVHEARRQRSHTVRILRGGASETVTVR